MSRPRFESPDHRIRTTLGAAGLIGVGGSVVSLVGRVPRFRHSATRRWARAARRFLDIDLDVQGADLVDPNEQYVVAPLHEGFADALALLHLPLDLRFAVRDELADWRHLGRYLRSTDQLVLPTKPSSGSLRSLYRGAETTFARGESLVVFPQGSILGIEAAFQPGAFRIAARFGRPVLPVVITGTHLVWEHPYSPVLRYGQRVSLRVLEPVAARHAIEMARAVERNMKAVAMRDGMAPVRRFIPERDGWWDGYDYEIDPDHAELAAAVSAHRADLKDSG